MPENKKEVAVTTQENSPAALIAQAIEKGLSVESLTKLMDLQDRWEAKKAKKEFDIAMSAAQGEFPIIEKKKKVMNKADKGGGVRYSYATIEAIVKEVAPIISKHGLSYTFTTTVVNNVVTATVKVTHEAGHSQETGFPVPIDTSAYMSQPQMFAAALTFGKRYAFLNAFGITTAEEDTDAQDVKTAQKVVDVSAYEKKIKAATNLPELTKIWSDLPANIKPLVKEIAAIRKAELGGSIPQ